MGKQINYWLDYSVRLYCITGYYDDNEEYIPRSVYHSLVRYVKKIAPALKRTLRESDREFLERLRKEGADLQIEQLREKTDGQEV